MARGVLGSQWFETNHESTFSGRTSYADRAEAGRVMSGRVSCEINQAKTIMTRVWLDH
jgi:hypothetical protein